MHIIESCDSFSCVSFNKLQVADCIIVLQMLAESWETFLIGCLGVHIFFFFPHFITLARFIVSNFCICCSAVS